MTTFWKEDRTIQARLLFLSDPTNYRTLWTPAWPSAHRAAEPTSSFAARYLFNARSCRPLWQHSCIRWSCAVLPGSNRPAKAWPRCGSPCNSSRQRFVSEAGVFSISHRHDSVSPSTNFGIGCSVALFCSTGASAARKLRPTARWRERESRYRVYETRGTSAPAWLRGCAAS